MHEHSPKHLIIGSARMKDKNTEEEAKKSGVNMERSTNIGHEKKNSNSLAVAQSYCPPLSSE